MRIGLKITCLFWAITPELSCAQQGKPMNKQTNYTVQKGLQKGYQNITLDYQRRSLQQHNSYRTKYHAPALQMDNALNNFASKCALYYAKKRAIDHSCRDKQKSGENIWMGIRGKWTDKQCAEMSVKSWVDDEVKYYNFDKPGFNKKTGHFTQVVWKNTKKLGFGCARSGDRTVGVALYSPPGNYIGQFKENVLKP